METFPLPYLFEAKKKAKYANTAIVFESQRKQIQRRAVNSLKTWTISCKGSNDDREVLEAFYDLMYGTHGKFLFYNENNEPVVARFATDEPEYTLIREFSTTEVTHGTVVGFSASISIEGAM